MTRHQKMYERYQAGESPERIASDLGIPPQRVVYGVQRYADAKGLPLRSGLCHRRGRRRVVIPDNLLQAYEAGDLTRQKLAKELNCSVSTIDASLTQGASLKARPRRVEEDGAAVLRPAEEPRQTLGASSPTAPASGPALGEIDTAPFPGVAGPSDTPKVAALTPSGASAPPQRCGTEGWSASTNPWELRRHIAAVAATLGVRMAAEGFGVTEDDVIRLIRSVEGEGHSAALESADLRHQIAAIAGALGIAMDGFIQLVRVAESEGDLEAVAAALGVTVDNLRGQLLQPVRDEGRPTGSPSAQLAEEAKSVTMPPRV